jgi:hypothetical protein
MLICKITETKTVRNNGKPQEETTEWIERVPIE